VKNKIKTPICRICSNKITSEDQLVFNKIPLCNSFPSEEVKKPKLHNLKIGACRNCGLVQLTEYPSSELIVPTHSWIRYNEPESHLIEVSNYLNCIFFYLYISSM